MRKKPLIILFFVVLLLGAGLVYLNAYVLPVHLKAFIVQRAEDFFGRKVSFSRISYQPVKGIVIEDLVIFEKDDPGTPFVQVDEIYGNVLLPPLFKNKNVVISGITVTRPRIHVVLNENKKWNFSDLLARPRRSAKKHPFNFFLTALSIQNGQVRFDSVTLQGGTTDIFQDINLRVRLSLKKGISFDARSRAFIQNAPPGGADLSQGSVAIKGNVTLPPRRWKAFFLVENIPVSKYLDLFDVLNDADGPRLENVFLPQAQIQVTRDKDAWDIRGNVAGLTGSFFSPRYWLTGRLAAQGMTLGIKNGAIDLAGRFEITGAEGASLDSRHFKSRRLLLDDLTLTKKNETFALKADLKSDGTFIQWKKGNVLTGDVTLADALFQRKTQGVHLQGNLAVAKANLMAPDITLQGNIRADAFTFSSQEKLADLKGLFRLDEIICRIQKDKSIIGTFTAKDTHIIRDGARVTITANIESEPTVAVFKDITFRGAPVLMGHVAVDPSRESRFAYSGSLILNEATLEGLPRVQTARQISGRIDFETGTFRSHHLDLVTMGMPVLLSGSMTNPKNPSVNVTAKIPDADCEKLITLLPAGTLPAGLIPVGKADIDLAYEGPARNPKFNALKATAALKDVSLGGLKVPSGWPETLTGISGHLSLNRDTLTWKDLKAAYQGKSYSLNGTLSDFSAPLIETSIVSSLMNLSTLFKMNGNLISISSLKGKYLDTFLDLKGEIEREQDAPYLDVKGRITLALKDLATLFPKLAQKNKILDLKGEADCEGHFKGKVTDLRNSIMAASVLVPSLTVTKHTFENVAIYLEHGTKNVSELKAKAAIYGGQVVVNSTFDLKEDIYPFRLNGYLEKIDLFKARRALKVKASDLRGTLNLNLAAAGSLKDFNTIEGFGDVSITDGVIWKLKILQGVWKLLFVPEFEGLVFSDATASFAIKNRRITSDDIRLKGQVADMVGQGWIDFDKNINFTVSPSFKETEIVSLQTLQKNLSSLLAQTEGYISIKIAGTLDKPHYSVDTFPTRMIEKATGLFLKGVGDTLKDILQ